MKDDVSEIPSSGCSYLVNATTLYNYSNGTRRTFYQVGGKWILSNTQTYSYEPTNYNCIDPAELHSNAVYLPIYYFIAFLLVIVAIVLFWRVLRRILLWH